jgi:TRAP-type mannitol/chloroaromatic compound transport system substrate-binding protein
MERRSFVRGAGLAGVLAAGVAPAIVHAQPTLRWRLTSSFPKALDTLFGVNETFAQKVKELTRVASSRSPCMRRANWCLPSAWSTLSGRHRRNGEHRAVLLLRQGRDLRAGCAIPFGLNSRQMTAWYYEGNGLKLMREFYRQYNIVNFPMGNTGAQMGGWFRKEIKSLADMKGLKFRVGGFAGKVVERMGGVPQNIPGGEIYQALEKGTIDAAEWVGPYDDQKLGFFKVAQNYAYPGWWEGGPQLDLHVNTKAYDSLSAEYKAIIEAPRLRAHVDMQAKYDGKNAAALKQLVAGGAKLFPFPKD